MSEMCIDLA